MLRFVFVWPIPAQRMEKNGFTLEGLMRNAITKDGDIYNLYIYGKLI